MMLYVLTAFPLSHTCPSSSPNVTFPILSSILCVITSSFQAITLGKKNTIFFLFSLISLFTLVVFPLPANIPVISTQNSLSHYDGHNSKIYSNGLCFPIIFSHLSVGGTYEYHRIAPVIHLWYRALLTFKKKVLFLMGLI